MSVIDTLFFVFKGDTRDAEQALDRTEKKAGKTEGAIGSLIKKGVGVIGGALAIGSIASHASEAADQMVKLAEASDRMNVPVGELDAWSRTIEDAGGSADSFIGTLKGLNSNIQMIKVKGTSRAMPFFEELGFTKDQIANTKDVMQLLPDLADKLSKMDAQEAIGYGEKLGIDEATIGVLMQGRKATEDMVNAQKKLGVMTEEDKDKIKEYDDAMDNLGRVFQQVWRTVAMLLVPAVQKIGEVMVDAFSFVKEHKSLIEGLGIALAIGLGVMGVAAVYSFVTSLNVMKVAALAAAAAEYLLMLPIILIIGLVLALAAAFAVLYDDFKTWTEGGDSFLGDHLGTWEDFKNKIIGWIDEIVAKWESFKQFFSDAKKNAMDLVTLKGVDFEAVKSGASALWQDIKGAGEAIGIGSSQAAIAGSTSFNTAAPASATQNKTNNTSVQTGNITINTQATDAQGVAGALSDELSKQLKDATAASDNGVAA